MAQAWPKKIVSISGCPVSGAGSPNLTCKGSYSRRISWRINEQEKCRQPLNRRIYNEKIRSLEEMCVFPEVTLETLLPPMLGPGQDFVLPCLSKDGEDIVPEPSAFGNHDPGCGGNYPYASKKAVVMLWHRQTIDCPSPDLMERSGME
ncbi:hypothetical protein [Paenibacillus maysiensis]|uniref:hypothetical protein n=1 Tax=Paenibacillus maysiensis TaxID=1155954 RepID=UPI000470CA34|nr:hypothetical protein [Paenibacillus maysiensis]